MLQVIVVAVGGAVGSVVRYSLGRAFAGPAASFPWTTLLINIVGCGLLGLFFGFMQGRTPSHALQSFVCVGLLGGFTTFSLFGYETLTLWQAGRSAAAIGYVFAAVSVGLIAVWSGHQLGTLA